MLALVQSYLNDVDRLRSSRCASGLATLTLNVAETQQGYQSPCPQLHWRRPRKRASVNNKLINSTKTLRALIHIDEILLLAFVCDLTSASSRTSCSAISASFAPEIVLYLLKLSIQSTKAPIKRRIRRYANTLRREELGYPFDLARNCRVATTMSHPKNLNVHSTKGRAIKRK